MEGQAIITIKGKDGKIKKQVTEKNVVFDIPKELLKSLIKNLDLGMKGSVQNYSGSLSFSNSETHNLEAITDFDLWFKAISVNDEACSEADFKDWKMPVLYGGEEATQDSNNKRYVYIDTTNSAMTGNVLKKCYTWNDCPAFTLRSINLKHANCASKRQEPYWGTYPIKRYGKYHFFIGGYNNYQYSFKGMQPNRLCEKDGFEWANGDSGVKFKGLKCSPFATSGSSGVYQPAIYACKDREIMVLRITDDMTTDDTSSGAYKYLYVIDADTGAIKRRFTLTQFAGITPYSTYHPSLSTTKIIATEYGNFLLAQKVYTGDSTYSVALWRIPDQSEYSNYENGETISVWQDNFITNWSGWYCYVTAINNYIIFSSNGANRKTIKINSATPGDITTYNYNPFNLPSSYSVDWSYVPIVAFNKYGDDVYQRSAYGHETWYNTTALNLSEGVEVAAGDTLTIEYTITAN